MWLFLLYEDGLVQGKFMLALEVPVIDTQIQGLISVTQVDPIL